MVHRRHCGRAQRPGYDGFTLVEAMVALLVLSVGVIGAAALHGQSLAAGRTAIYRSQAVSLASDMAERIRLNRRAQSAYQGVAADHGCDEPTDAGGRDCTPAELAADDLLAWNSAIAATLPVGQGSVSVDTGTNSTTYTVTVSWNDATASGRTSFPLTFRLSVYDDSLP